MCTQASHDALRADPEAMRRETTPNGVQYLDGVAVFEHRQCRCGSDLALILDEEFAREMAVGA